MKRNVILPLMILGLALIAPPLHARGDFAPDRRDMRDLRRLARDLDREAGWFAKAVKPQGGLYYRPGDRDDHHRNQRNDIHRRDRHEERLHRRAEHFARDARDFEKSVERHMRHPERTLSAFRQIVASHHALSGVVRRSSVDHREKRRWAEIRELVTAIRHYYRKPERPRIDWERVQYLAHQVDALSQRVYAEAKRELLRRASPRYDRRVREALERFDELRDAAAHFHRQVEKGRRDPSHIRSDFDRLVNASHEAKRYIWPLEYETRRAYERLAARIDELDARCYGRERGRHYVKADPVRRSPVRTRTVQPRYDDLEEAWPRLLVSLLGGDLKF